MAFDYDLFVIGGGSGGVRAARMSAEAGAKVGLAEESRMGGTCVIRGCVPKKLMVFASGYKKMIDDAQAYGWSHREGGFDWPAFRGKLHAELDRLEEVYRSVLSRNNVAVHDSRAWLEDPHTVAMAGGKTVTAKHILIATGGHPVRPEMENADMGIVSDDIFQLEKLPKSILIVGGGYIACEFACILNGLGVEVTQFYRGSQILRGFDSEARDIVSDSMRAKGVDLHLGADVAEISPANDAGKKTGGKVRVKTSGGMEKEFDTLFYATGRAPSTKGLGLEECGVEIGRKGEVIVDDYSQSAVPSIYAIGDVTGRVQLTPVAIREGAAFTETVFKGNPTKVDHELVASVVFTQPELGTVGLTEDEAAGKEEIEVYRASFKPMRESFAGRPDQVLMKLVVSKATRKVLGCHIVADGAGEMIQLAGVAVKMGATKEDFDRTCAVHPTMAEELVTMAAPAHAA